EDAREVAVVPDRRERGRVDGQRLGGQGPSLLDDRVHELDRHVLRVARGPAVSHHPHTSAGPPALGERADAALDPLRLGFEEAQHGVGALARLAQDGGLHAVARSYRPYW